MLISGRTRDVHVRLDVSLVPASSFFFKYFSDIRSQLNEQMRCLDVRQDAHSGMLVELQDFFRRRAEVELDYSRNLDKLAKSIATRHKQEKLK